MQMVLTTAAARLPPIFARARPQRLYLLPRLQSLFHLYQPSFPKAMAQAAFRRPALGMLVES